MGKNERNPFKPGAGEVPPYRAGHEDASNWLTDRIKMIRDGESGGGVVIFGPRGNGKTALLAEAEENAGKLGVRAVSLRTSSMKGDPSRLANLLRVKKWYDFARNWRVSGGAGGVSGGVELKAAPDLDFESTLREALDKSPVLLMLDEAHNLPPDLGNLILQVAQGCFTHRLPLLLVLAGTPVLPSRLGRMDATFWERFMRFRIGRLESQDATRKAFSVPVERAGAEIDEDALDLLVRESQDYPYFVQVLGWAAWSAAAGRFAEGERRITLEDAKAGIEAAKKRVSEFYLSRYVEVEEFKVLAEAVAVSKAFIAEGEHAEMSNSRLNDLLATTMGGTEDSLLQVKDKLANLGLIWQSVSTGWAPGIPSLCSYLAEHEVKRVRS